MSPAEIRPDESGMHMAAMSLIESARKFRELQLSSEATKTLALAVRFLLQWKLRLRETDIEDSDPVLWQSRVRTLLELRYEFQDELGSDDRQLILNVIHREIIGDRQLVQLYDLARSLAHQMETEVVA